MTPIAAVEALPRKPIVEDGTLEDDLDRRDGRVAARAAHRGEDLALARIGERMEARERADVIEIRDHVRIKDDLDGIRENG